MLSDGDRAVLDLEGQHWSTTGGKLDAIRATGVTPTRHAQRLNALLDDPLALSYAPMVVNRLRRLREVRQRGSARQRR